MRVRPYPLFFEPVFKERIWGGEAWVISDHPRGRTRVRNGQLAGNTLAELWRERRQLFGQNGLESFPLLVKVIETSSDLSVQVHPDNEYAFLTEKGDGGKTEAWLVLQADPGARIVYGHRAKNREQFKRMVERGAWEELLVQVPVRTGEFYFVPSGCIHAIGAGIVVLEIQQSSDITYRVYDYDRIDKEGNRRELHLDKAYDVVLFGAGTTSPPVVMRDGLHELVHYVQCPFFTMNGWNIRGDYESCTRLDSFILVSVIKGEGKFTWSDNEVSIVNGDHFLIPAPLGKFKVKGELDLAVTML